MICRGCKASTKKWKTRISRYWDFWFFFTIQTITNFCKRYTKKYEIIKHMIVYNGVRQGWMYGLDREKRRKIRKNYKKIRTKSQKVIDVTQK